MAFGVGSAGVDARIDAGVVDTGRLVTRAFAVRCAFSGADPVGIAVVALLMVKVNLIRI